MHLNGVVFTKTSNELQWANTFLAKDNLVEEVIICKNQSGKDILVNDSTNFVTSLIREKLINE